MVTALRLVQRNPLESILSTNAEILRKTSSLGAKYCGLNDACIIFTINAPTIITLLSAVLGLLAVTTSIVVKRTSPKVMRAVLSSRGSQGSSRSVSSSRDIVEARNIATIRFSLNKRNQTIPAESLPSQSRLTSFEENCLGSPFRKLFYDCDDFAYKMYNGKCCTTVESLLLTGYLYYGEHIYQATSVLLLIVARLLPRKLLRTFNVLILRWHLNPTTGTLTHALSCTWYTASKENHALNGMTPVA